MTDSFLDQRPTLPELTEHVNVGTEWRKVGIQLKLNPGRLNAIDVECADTDAKLSKMYELWLSTTPDATRRQLLQVLRLSSIAEHTIASKYEEFRSQFISTEDGHGLPKYTKAGTDDTTVHVVSGTANSRSTVGNSQRGQVNARELLRSHSDRLTTAMSCVLLEVTNNLHAKGLIPLQMKDEVLITGVLSDYTKASKLMSVLQKLLDAHSNPDQYLADICDVFIKQQPLQDITSSIIQQLQLSVQVDYSTTGNMKTDSCKRVDVPPKQMACKNIAHYRSDVAAKVIQSNVSLIKKKEINLNHLTETLVSCEVISKIDKDEITDRRSSQTEDERMSRLLDIVIATIEENGTVFGQLLEIFEKEYAQRGKSLANTLRSKYNEECKKMITLY